MKSKLAMCAVGTLALAAIGMSEYHKADVNVSSAPIFHLIGDSQQELTRLPVTLTRISDDEEISIGNTLAESYSRNWEDTIKGNAEYKDAQSYVEQVGLRVASRARRKLPYKFHYIPDENFVNAFALPGGHIFIGQGLIHLMDSEDELAGVLGHEVEHVDLGHCAERVQLEARLRRLHIERIGSLATIPYDSFVAGYSKEQEMAADRDGTQLAVFAEYSPVGPVRMFQTFEQFEPELRKAGTPQQELSGVALGGLAEYFRTHPRSSERVAQIQQLIASQQWPVRSERDLRIGYIGLNLDANSALKHYDYARAKALASRSLKLSPNQIAPLEVAYYASMYTGDFAFAADAAEKMIVRSQQPAAEASTDSDDKVMNANADLVVNAHRLADALAAQRVGPSGAARFEEATRRNRLPPRMQLWLDTDVAGLRLLAGDGGRIRELQIRIHVQDDDAPPNAASLSPKAAGEILARIGHWYYVSGKYDEALKQLSAAQELSPDLPGISLEIGWAALQCNKIQTAQSSLETDGPDAGAGLAVIMWRSEDKDGAVSKASELVADPRWRNERWVSSTYGPSVFKTLTDIETERQHRLKARK